MIEFLKNYQSYRKGQKVKFGEDVAISLVRLGVAKFAHDSKMDSSKYDNKMMSSSYENKGI